MNWVRSYSAPRLRLVTAITLATLLHSAGTAHASPLFFVESGGQVVMEAEAFSIRSAAVDLPDGPADSDADQWLIVTSEFAGSDPFSNARGEFLQVSDANGLNGEGNFSDPTGLGPFVDYIVRITTLGDFRLFARWDSPSGQNNSFYAMLLDPLGSLVGSSFTFTSAAHTDLDFATNPWQDVNADWTIATAGDYTVRLAPREDGVAVDTLVFQLNSLSAPTGNGPAATIPVPEPNTLLLVSLGLFGLAVLGRRRTPELARL